MSNEAPSSNRGAVVSVRGSVVDVRFDRRLPPIFSVLRAGAERHIVIEVMAQLDACRVRGIALTPTQGLARGMTVEDTGAPLQAPSVRRLFLGCSMCSVGPSTASRRHPTCNGDPSIAHHHPYPSVPPNPRFSRQASRPSMCSFLWSAVAKRVYSGARV